MSHYVFGGVFRKSDQKDHSNALQITMGVDSFSSIGPPPNVTSSQVKSQVSNVDQQWIEALRGCFPKTK